MPTQANQENNAPVGTFEEQIDMLFEELSFAVRSERPSILLASYQFEYQRDLAEIVLAKRIAAIGQALALFLVDESHFDVPLLLSRRPDRANSVFSITGLSHGGGRQGANAYRALNMRREFFVDYAMRLVIWLSRDEAVALSVHAPDFWAFRHRAVECNLPPEPCDQSIKRLKQGLAMARTLGHVDLLAKCWGHLGRFYLDCGQRNCSIRAFRKATRINPMDANLWIELGYFYHVTRRDRDAIIAYQRAVSLDPQKPSVHGSLAECYRSLGKDGLAEEQMELALAFTSDTTE